RIELGEIESRLMKHPDIKDAVVLAIEENGDKYLSAYIVFNNEPVIPGLREYLSKELPEYMIPSYFISLEKIPLTANGKLDRKALPKPGVIASENYTPPRNEIEKKLVEIWSEVLEQTSIGINDDFFELGGHSLKATILTSKIHKSFNARVPLTEIFKNPTIRGLADKIRAAIKDTYVSIITVEKKDYYPLSSAHKRMYILQQIDKQGIGYNIPAFFELEGEIDHDRLEQTFKMLIARHESLRTSFHMINDEPMQQIHDTVEFEIKKLDGRGDPLWSPFIRPFDLSQAPLLRIGLVEEKGKEKGDRHILMIDMDHIIADGASINILVKDFMALYQGEELPELRVQYKDFSIWQNSRKQMKLFVQQEEYWLKELAGEIPILELPFDYVRPPLQSFEGSAVAFEINKEMTEILKKFVKETDTTIYMLLLAIYTVFLAKVANQEDIIVGSPIAGRRHADLENIIGMFVNTLALRSYPVGEKRFIDFLSEVKEIALKGFENQEYQFEDLVEQVAIERNMERSPLFDTMLVLQNTGAYEINIPGLNLVPYKYDHKISKFDLSLIVIEAEEKLHLTFEYCTKLFKWETIQKFIAYFKNIIGGIIENKERRIGDFEIITAEEKRQILFDFNNTEAQYPKDKTVHQLFAEQVLKTPDYIAVFGHGRQRRTRTNTDNNITYFQLNDQSDRLAGLLIEMGVLPDSIVAIMIERSIEMIIGILGILKSGGAYLPIDPDYPPERIDYMLKDSNAKIIIINKSEIRISKSETNPNDQNTNDQNKNQHSGAVSVLNFENLNFEFVSC
ncbi:MAG TPA: condensation domain-containing protein, partial [Candidatus Kapabacteria bacterium]|nr:condensation domain-containing protein [Candidatus Kapabacteria bacterium]